MSLLDPNFNKLILISIVEPPKQYTIIPNKEYSEIVQKQVTLYNNIYKNIQVNMILFILMILKLYLYTKYDINDYLMDGSGHIYNNLKTIHKYTKIMKDALKESDIPIYFYDELNDK